MKRGKGDIQKGSQTTGSLNSPSGPGHLVWGRNAVLEMLRAQTRPVHKILLAEGAKNPRISELIDLARASNIPIERVSGNTLDQLTRNNKHQGVVAVVAVKSFLDEEELLAHLTPTSVLVILDEVEDPHNLGAIIRTAHCAGADAVVITKHRSAGLSEVVAKASAGAIEYLPVVRVTNLVSFFERLKEADVRVIGVDPAGGSTYNRYPYTRPLALVFGGEGKGLRRLTRERCDERLSIPLRGKIDSLNVSVAVGVVLFEVLRQREQRK